MADWVNRRHHSRAEVKRDGHDEIGVREQLGAGLLEPAGEQGEALLAIPYLKLWISSRMVSEKRAAARARS